MTQIASLRLLDAHEIATVSGGDDDEIVVVGPRRVTNTYELDPFYTLNSNITFALGDSWLNSGGGGGGGGSAPAPSDPEDGDMDGDGIPDSVDTEDNREIVVTATPEQVAAAQGWYTFFQVGTYTSIIGLAALGGFLGLTGLAGASFEAAAAALGLTAEELTNMMADLGYQTDSWDGAYDGFSPIYPAGQLQPGHFMAFF